MIRNIFPKIFLSVFHFAFYFAFLFSLFFSLLNNTYAQSDPSLNRYDRNAGVACANDPSSPACRGSGVSDALIQKAVADRELLNPKPVSPSGDSGSCLSWSGFSVLNCLTSVVDAVFGLILRGLNILLGGFVWLAAFILDLTIYFTIIEFKTNFADLEAGGIGAVLIGNQAGGLINYLWGMIRDFLNIIIFILVIYSAVRSMFEGFESTRNKFIALLVFSIVVNFSLLFVKIAIDISNILALQAYTLAVKPASVADFYQFRTSGTGDVKNYAEYIMNSIDMEKLVNRKTGTNVATQEVKDKTQTFMFQLGKFITYLGLIYIFLFIAGLLVARAITFLFAMILAPLIAVDIFFSFFSKASPQMNALVARIRGFTTKIKGNFYEGLVKGPILIFFIFLIGIFAESILSQGVIDTVSGSLNKLPDVKNMNSAFTDSIFVFFKFGLFLFLCMELFRRIEDIKFEGSGMVSRIGTKLGSFGLGRTLGGLSRVTSFAGRRVLGQGLAAGNLGKSLGNGFETLRKSNNPLLSSVGRTGLSTLDKLKGGNYDARNTKTASVLGNLINKASGVDLSKSVGTAITQGFEARNKAKADEAQKKLNDEIKTAQDHVSLTKEQETDAQDNTKVDIAGGKFNAAEITKAIEAAAKNPDAEVEIGTGPNMRRLSGADLGIFVKNTDTNQSPADNALAFANRDVETAKAKKLKENKDKVAEAIKARVANKTGPSYLAGAADEIFKSNISGRDIQGDMADAQKLEFAVKAQKKAEDDRIKARKTSAQISLLRTNFVENTERVLDEINTFKVNKIAGKITPTSAEEASIESARQTINEFYRNRNNIDAKNVGDFNKNVLPKLMSDKQTALDTIVSIYARSDNAELRGISKAKNSPIKKLRENVKKTEVDYTKQLPKEEVKKVEAVKPATPATGDAKK